MTPAMTQASPDQLAAIAKDVIMAASDKNLVLRVLGGVGVLVACPGIAIHPSLQRTIKDIDFAAERRDFDALAGVFAAHGANLRSKEREQWVFERDGVEMELTPPGMREDHRIDLSQRLALASPTLPMADLLLIKLQRVNFAEKDIRDSIAILLDHRVAEGDEQEQIDPKYIAKLCGRDWGLFTTAYGNAVKLEQVADQYLEPDEAQLVWRRIETIQAEMDRQPKSLLWMLNQAIRRPTGVPA